MRVPVLVLVVALAAGLSGAAVAASYRPSTINLSAPGTVSRISGQMHSGPDGSSASPPASVEGGRRQPGPSAVPVSPPAPQTAASTPEERFIAAAVPAAQQGWREYAVPASVTIAQAILESGWGQSRSTVNDRNYFGIKCFGGSPGPIGTGCHTYSTFECTPNCRPEQASFRTYTSMTDSFRDHGRFLTSYEWYRPAFAHSRDPNRFLEAIWRSGYATDPEYYSKVTGLMTRYNLYQYDIWK
jgi:flagellum-specific peptidoglycan hydrolase FlgJ